MSAIGQMSAVLPVNLGGVGPGDPRFGTTNGGAPVANQAYLSKFQVFAPITVSQVRFAIQAQNGNIDIGIYDAAGNRIASTGSTACPSATPHALSLTAAVTLLPGRIYYGAIAADGTVVRWVAFYDTGPSIAFDGGVLNGVKATSFPLPTSVTGLTYNSVANSFPVLSFIP